MIEKGRAKKDGLFLLDKIFKKLVFSRFSFNAQRVQIAAPMSEKDATARIRPLNGINAVAFRDFTGLSPVRAPFSFLCLHKKRSVSKK